MKKMLIKYVAVFLTSAAFIVFSACSLQPEFGGVNSEAPPLDNGAPTPPDLSTVYGQLNQLVGQSNWHALEEHSTDELMGPTRGTDWDDFGTWRKIHLHTWDASHNQLNDTWNGLNGALYLSTLLAETGSGQPQAEAKFLRAYFSYLVCDLFGQVQHRPATSPANEIPEVYTRSEAIDFIISELESVKDALPAYDHDNRSVATKEAAEFLLAKCYLNKAVYKQDPTQPAGPFTFDAGDMNKVIENCNAIMDNPNLSISSYYWNNFVWDNGVKSTEDIFVRKNSEGINVVWLSCMGNHYFMPPDGWNGFTTLSDFYDSFDDNDIRKGDSIPGFTNLSGRPAGFLIGQQRGPTEKHIGNPIVNLTERSGTPLIFTKDVSLFFSTESKGIRTNKYPLDPSSMNDGGWGSGNDFVFFRFADVLLMKAEAILRGGNDPRGETPVDLVNAIRSKRNVSDLSSIDLPGLLAERGRELYLEGWRRNDMIRFEVFNNPVQERPDPSDPSRVVFPIPNIALSSNPNLIQNFGY